MWNISCVQYYFQRSRENNVPDFIQSNYFKEGYRKFQNFYKKWFSEITLEEELHPWDQFKNYRKKNDSVQ